MGKEWLDMVTPDKIFYVVLDATGACVKVYSLEELRDTLRDSATDETITHHIHDHTNDFAKWVEQVIGDVALGQQIRKAGIDKDTIVEVLTKRIEWIKKTFI